MSGEENSECKCKNSKNLFSFLKQKTQKKIHDSLPVYLKSVTRAIEQDTAFYTYDFADVLWKVQLWREKFPNVVPYYAVKANADPVLIRLFVLLGYGFDCSTEGEMKLVLEAKADPRKIIFAHTVKIPKALKYASSVGVNLVTFDSKEELDKIHEHFPEVRLILRIKSASTQSVYNLSKKFGCELSEVEQLLSRAKELNMNVVGVSFHVGACCGEPETFITSINNSRVVFDISKRLGLNFSIMDIGAGFFGSRGKEDYFHELSDKINNSLSKNFPGSETQLIAEPGCYYVCSAVSLTTAIIGKKSIIAKDQEKREYFLNDGFYGSFFCHFEIYDVRPKPLLTTTELRLRSMYPSNVWGQTCCSEDLIQEGCSLPDMEEGEFIVWENMGAYNLGVYSTFTCVPMPESRYVFVNNPKLNLNWLHNLEEIADYIAEVADLVEDGVEQEN